MRGSPPFDCSNCPLTCLFRLPVVLSGHCHATHCHYSPRLAGALTLPPSTFQCVHPSWYEYNLLAKQYSSASCGRSCSFFEEILFSSFATVAAGWPSVPLAQGVRRSKPSSLQFSRHKTSSLDFPAFEKTASKQTSTRINLFCFLIELSLGNTDQ